MSFEPVIGLEVHCQLSTASKLFCGCSTRFGALANHQVCPICLGMPGTLPVLNEKAVEYAVRMALAVQAHVNTVSIFARKQYFYPDLPKGYQITQYDRPYCEGGSVSLSDGRFIRLTRIHLEEDAGKNVHAAAGSAVDCNRAGMPLIEIVSQPEIQSAADAADYLRCLRSLVRHLGISDGNLEEGSFRCDANVSVRPHGQNELGTRCEIKNLNSFRNVERAINYEIQRQIETIESGGRIKQQTMLFDADSGKTSPMRSKEDSHDYRYMPDPDLPPLLLTPDRIENIRSYLPELPQAMAKRFIADYDLAEAAARILTSDRDLAVYFEETCRLVAGRLASKSVGNFFIAELVPLASELNWNLSSPPVSQQNLAELFALIGTDVISGKIAKTVFDQMARVGGEAQEIVERLGLVQISDGDVISALVERVLDANTGQVQQYLSGKDKLFGFFIGQIMKESQGKMNPGLVNDILKARLAARGGSVDR